MGDSAWAKASVSACAGSGADPAACGCEGVEGAEAGASSASCSLQPGVLSCWGLWAKKHTRRVQLRPSLQGWVRYLHARA